MSRLSEAHDLAVEAHEGLMYGKDPYMFHIYAVLSVLVDRLGYSEEYEDLFIACLLHDTVEDTDVRISDIALLFGERVAALVDAVTCRPARSRKEKFAEAYPRIRATKGAVLVKLADRLANVRAGIATRSPLVLMYLKEYPTFRDELRDPSDALAKPMWDELDRLLGWEPS